MDARRAVPTWVPSQFPTTKFVEISMLEGGARLHRRSLVWLREGVVRGPEKPKRRRHVEDALIVKGVLVLVSVKRRDAWSNRHVRPVTSVIWAARVLALGEPVGRVYVPPLVTRVLFDEVITVNTLYTSRLLSWICRVVPVGYCREVESTHTASEPKRRVAVCVRRKKVRTVMYLQGI
jgi:hypothetical protein